MNEKRPDLQDLQEKLDEVKDDPCLTNLYWRYFQNLELGDSHWREDMHLEKPEKESMQAEEERMILKKNPNADANLIRLRRKFERQLGD